MAPHRMLSRQEVERYLGQYGCVVIDSYHTGLDETFVVEVWKSAFGFTFQVPWIKGGCPEHRLFAILAELSELAPTSR